MYELRQLMRGIGFATNTVLDVLIPARVQVVMPFGPRTVWGPVETPPPAAAPVEDDGDDFPTGEFPLELAEQLRNQNVPAGGVESSTPPADSAAGGHPGQWTDSELLWNVALLLRGYAVLMAKYGQNPARVDEIRAEVAKALALVREDHRAAQFEAQDD